MLALKVAHVETHVVDRVKLQLCMHDAVEWKKFLPSSVRSKQNSASNLIANNSSFSLSLSLSLSFLLTMLAGASHIIISDFISLTSMTLYSCVSGDCHNTATKVCTSCKTTYYCSYDCQKAHWKKHKLTCNGPNAFPAMRPGIFDFMALPRKVRDKVCDTVELSLRAVY